jgi:hypothetical protein
LNNTSTLKGSSSGAVNKALDYSMTKLVGQGFKYATQHWEQKMKNYNVGVSNFILYFERKHYKMH